MLIIKIITFIMIMVTINKIVMKLIIIKQILIKIIISMMILKKSNANINDNHHSIKIMYDNINALIKIKII